MPSGSGIASMPRVILACISLATTSAAALVVW